MRVNLHSVRAHVHCSRSFGQSFGFARSSILAATMWISGRSSPHRVLPLLLKLIAFLLLIVPCTRWDAVAVAQDAGFEIPVQLIGFPVIVMAVRTSNFVRKLAYALNPGTYRRSIRAATGTDSSDRPMNYKEANRLLMKELGPDYCIYKDVCLEYINTGKINTRSEWTKLYDEYSQFRDDKQRTYYTMSAILGNHFKSKKLCSAFDELGRSCTWPRVQRLGARQ